MWSCFQNISCQKVVTKMHSDKEAELFVTTIVKRSLWKTPKWSSKMMKVQGTEASIIVGKCTQLKQLWILVCEICKGTYVFHQILLRLCREKYFVGLATLFEPPSPMALKVTYSSDNCLFKMYFSSLLFFSRHLFLCLTRFFLHSECFKI